MKISTDDLYISKGGCNGSQQTFNSLPPCLCLNSSKSYNKQSSGIVSQCHHDPPLYILKF